MIAIIKYDELYRPYYFYKDSTLIQCSAPDCNYNQFIEGADDRYVQCISCGALHQAVKDVGE